MDIEKFIVKFKDNYPNELEYAFSNGNCYHFALILKNIFPNGCIIYNIMQGHFIYEYQNKLYDIQGEVTKKHDKQDLIYWDKFDNYDPLVKQRLIRDCVYKLDYVM